MFGYAKSAAESLNGNMNVRGTLTVAAATSEEQASTAKMLASDAVVTVIGERIATLPFTSTGGVFRRDGIGMTVRTCWRWGGAGSTSRTDLLVH